MYTVQVKCFNAPLQPAEIFGVKKVVEEKVPEVVNELGLTLTGVEWQNTADLSDLVIEEIENQKKWHLRKNVKSRVQFSEQKGWVFYLAKSYNLAGKRAEAYSLYRRACSLTDTALKRLQSSTTVDEEVGNVVKVCTKVNGMWNPILE
ncbi:hypothetical protein AgCh_035904 [Apium graveolens]